MGVEEPAPAGQLALGGRIGRIRGGEPVERREQRLFERLGVVFAEELENGGGEEEDEQRFEAPVHGASDGLTLQRVSTVCAAPL